MNAKQYCSYALDENNRLINAADEEKGSGHEYFCHNCGSKMILRKGEKNRPHFAHKKNIANCSYESYLHKTAKLRIRECFEKSSRFTISYRPEATCSVKKCPIGVPKPCEWKESVTSFNLKDYYDNCLEEVSLGDFRADLLLKHSKKDSPPTLIEIYVTHESSEEKIKSGNRIIEIKIESEKDIDDIISNATICETEGYLDRWENKPNNKIRFYNFKIHNTIPPIEHQKLKFRFWIDSKNWYHCDYRDIGDDDYDDIDHCLTPNTPEIENSKYLIVSEKQINLDFAFKKLSQSGLKIRYCRMCQFYRYNDAYLKRLCILYKSKGTPQFPKPLYAQTCPLFKLIDYSTFLVEDQECMITQK